MTQFDVIQLLRQRMRDMSQLEFGEKSGFHQAEISETLNGLRRPSRKMLKFLGLKKVVSYERK